MAFRPKEQGIFPTMRIIVNFDVKTRIDSVVEIQKFILRAYAASKRMPTRARTCNKMTYLILSFIGFSFETKRTTGFI